MQEMKVQSLGGEDPLGKETPTHSSILALETPWTEELGGLQSMGSQKSWTRLVTKQQQPLTYFSEGTTKHHALKVGGNQSFTVWVKIKGSMLYLISGFSLSIFL